MSLKKHSMVALGASPSFYPPLPSTPLARAAVVQRPHARLLKYRSSVSRDYHGHGNIAKLDLLRVSERQKLSVPHIQTSAEGSKSRSKSNKAREAECKYVHLARLKQASQWEARAAIYLYK